MKKQNKNKTKKAWATKTTRKKDCRENRGNKDNKDNKDVKDKREANIGRSTWNKSNKDYK